MLEIVRGRTWSVAHTVYDDYDNGVLADLSHLVEYRCHIRSSVGVRNRKGFFDYPLIAAPLVTVEDSILTLSLTPAETAAVIPGNYVIDCMGLDEDGNTEALLEPEPVRFTDRPSRIALESTGGGASATITVPNFSEQYETALED